ncbi:hypothetical protein JZ751_029093 [Albula glossodonta]|uniref:Uncharacterized protein n=1 Tax=Albula glossodonta TaxID=121402 RepID=A0A8T2PAM7_9TELE|nr:hypothetical protein JZ751_029093 [Albula glossodonta]
MVTATDKVTRQTAAMMVGDWLTGGELTLLVRPARMGPKTRELPMHRVHIWAWNTGERHQCVTQFPEA